MLEFTEDGYESSFGTNHMGHALLTKLLLPLLLNTSESTSTTPGIRVVAVSSGAHALATTEAFDLEEIKTGKTIGSSFAIYA